MTTAVERLAARKAVELAGKVEGLRDELDHWSALADSPGPLHRHHSQVEAVRCSFRAPLAGLADRAGRAVPAGDTTSWRRLEHDIWLLHLVLDPYRQAFAGRLFPGGTPAGGAGDRPGGRHGAARLRFADELLWTFLPTHARSRVPLVIGGHRGTICTAPGGFPGHDVRATGDADRKTAREQLAAAAVPVVSLPWHSLHHLPELLIVAHEAGHLLGVEPDLSGVRGLTEQVRRWLPEITADTYGALVGGWAFVVALADYLSGSADRAGSTYPRAAVRLAVAAEVAGRCTDGLRPAEPFSTGEWSTGPGSTGPGSTGPGSTADTRVDPSSGLTVAGLVEELVSRPLTTRFPDQPGSDTTLQQLAASCVGPRVRADLAGDVTGDLLAGYEPGGDHDLPMLAASAALAFHQDPVLYRQRQVEQRLLARAEQRYPSDRRDVGRPGLMDQAERAGRRLAALFEDPDVVPASIEAAPSG